MFQVTNFQFENGATCSLSMVAFTSRLCAREVKVYGTKVRLPDLYIEISQNT